MARWPFPLILVLSVAGCAVGPDYTPPEVSVASAWHAPSEGGETNAAADVTNWWKVFGDEALNALIAEASVSNFDVRIAEARVREARAARGIVRADLYPRLDVSGSYRRQQLTKPDAAEPSVSFGGGANDFSLSRSTTLRTGDFTFNSSSSATRLSALLFGGGGSQQVDQGGQGGVQGGGGFLKPFQNRNISFSPDSQPSFDRTQDLYQAGFDATWELDIFGGNRRAVEAANADIEASEEGRRDVLVSLLAEVARNYLTLREAQSRLGIAQENIAAQQGSVDLTQSRFDAGLTSELDVSRARAQLATTQSHVPALENIIASTLYRLGVLLGKDPAALYDELSVESPLPPTPPEVPVGVPSDLLRRRADIRRAERELAAATARIGEATADLFPKFSLTGNFGFQSDNANDFTIGANQVWGFGPSVRWPIFDAGRIRANIEVQNARQEQALIGYEQAVIGSLGDVETSLVAYAKEQQRYASLDTAVTSEKRAVELANERYTRGLSDFINVLDTQRALYLAQDQLVQSQTTVLLNLVTLYKALGGGWESFETATAPRSTSESTEQG
ncbi:MAG: efflux transporter outer membrane subunit [Candidatus Hydrogenedentes bacterium]|nr:efflux transporter outer membrane subunit [Candidatus Hydrogenedentota bacterium]